MQKWKDEKGININILDISWKFRMFWWDDYIHKKVENLDKYGFFEEVEYEGQETVGSSFLIHKEGKVDGLKRIIRTNSSWWAEKEL